MILENLRLLTAPDTMTVIRLSTCVGAVVIDVGSA